MATTPTVTGLFTLPSWVVTALQDAQLLEEAVLTLSGTKASAATSGANAAKTASASPSLLTEIGNLVPKLPTDPITAGIDAGAEVAAAAGAVAGVVKQEDAEMNTDAMVKAAQDAQKQALIDKLTADLKAGNTDAIREDIAGR